MTHARGSLAMVRCLAAGTAAATLGGSGAMAQPSIGPFRGPTAGTAVGRAEIRDLVARINRHRRAIGSEPLTWDERLASVAQRHSEDMARRHYFDHVNPDGLDPFDRMRRAGIRFRFAAENLAAG